MKIPSLKPFSSSEKINILKKSAGIEVKPTPLEISAAIDRIYDLQKSAGIAEPLYFEGVAGFNRAKALKKSLGLEVNPTSSELKELEKKIDVLHLLSGIKPKQTDFEKREAEKKVNLLRQSFLI